MTPTRLTTSPATNAISWLAGIASEPRPRPTSWSESQSISNPLAVRARRSEDESGSRSVHNRRLSPQETENCHILTRLMTIISYFEHPPDSRRTPASGPLWGDASQPVANQQRESTRDTRQIDRLEPSMKQRVAGFRVASPDAIALALSRSRDFRGRGRSVSGSRSQ